MKAGSRLAAHSDVVKLLPPARAACQWLPNLNRGLSTATGAYLYTRESVAGVRCLEIGTPEQEENGIVLYIHGGGYVFGTPTLAKSIASLLSYYTDMKVICPAYRLAPEHPLPAATHDVSCVLKALVHSGRVAPERLSIVGDSAGGGLTLLTLQRLRDEGHIMPACAVPISPWTDLTCSRESHKRNAESDVMFGAVPRASFEVVADMAVGNVDLNGVQVAERDKAKPLFSPINASFKGLPPMYFTVGDTEVLLDDCIDAHARAVSEGVEAQLDVVEGMCHSFPLFTPIFPEATESVQRIAEFILSRTISRKDGEINTASFFSRAEPVGSMQLRR